MGQYGTAGPSVSGSPAPPSAADAEEIRLIEAREGRAPWKKWGSDEVMENGYDAVALKIVRSY